MNCPLSIAYRFIAMITISFFVAMESLAQAPIIQPPGNQVDRYLQRRRLTWRVFNIQKPM
jgi:hypothetical protein